MEANINDPESLGRLLQAMADQTAELRSMVTSLCMVLGMAIAVGDNPGVPKIALSGRIIATLDAMEKAGHSNDILSALRIAIEAGVLPPDPGSTDTGNIVALFKTVNAKAA